MFGFKKLRYLVPNCPKCNSTMTGRFILGEAKNEYQIVEKHYRKGERVRVINSFSIPYHNCYCELCDIRWHEDLHPKFYSKKQWQEICDNSYIENEYHYYSKAIRTVKEKDASSKKAIRKNRMKKIGKLTAYVILGINIDKEIAYIRKIKYKNDGKTNSNMIK